MKFLFCVALMAGLAYSGQRTEVVKLVKADTISQLDTVKLVKYDTLKITKTFKDTSTLVKTDTVVASSKPVKIVPKQEKPEAIKAPKK